MLKFRVPEATVQRLSVYLRTLKKFREDFVLSSQEFSESVGITECLIRKDLAWFGEFGTPGQGYRVEELKEEIARILGLNQEWGLALVGVGKLGGALLAYPGFKREKFQIKLAFDNNPKKIGKILEDVVIEHVEKIPQLLPCYGIKIGIITTPAETAQNTANKLIEGKVEGILNFAPTHLTIPDNIKVKNVDLSALLETLSFFLSHKTAPGTPLAKIKESQLSNS